MPFIEGLPRQAADPNMPHQPDALDAPDAYGTEPAPGVDAAVREVLGAAGVEGAYAEDVSPDPALPPESSDDGSVEEDDPALDKLLERISKEESPQVNDLIERFRDAHDEAVFGELVRLYSPRLRRAAIGIVSFMGVGGTLPPEDLVQEALDRVWERSRKFREAKEGALFAKLHFAYFYRVMRNLAYDERKAHRYQRLLLAGLPGGENRVDNPAGGGGGTEFQASAPSAEDAWTDVHDVELADAIIERIFADSTGLQRERVLRYFQLIIMYPTLKSGVGQAALGQLREELGVNANTLKQMAHRVRLRAKGMAQNGQLPELAELGIGFVAPPPTRKRPHQKRKPRRKPGEIPAQRTEELPDS